LTRAEQSEQGGGRPLTEKLKNLEVGDTIEVNCLDETLTVLSTSPPVCYEVYTEAPDGTKYDLRETLLDDDDSINIEPRKLNSTPILVRELEVIQ
jgi:hypothetical protein